jgi:DNA-binding NarL/FixJ family response regulator
VQVRAQGYRFDEPLVRRVFGNKTPRAVTTPIVSIESDPTVRFDTEHPKLPSTELHDMESLVAGNERYCADTRMGGKLERKVLIFESRIFLRECIKRSIQSALSIPVETLSSMAEFDATRSIDQVRLLIISLAEGNNPESSNALGVLTEVAASVPTIVLSRRHNFELMRAVICYGAKGYIPMTMGFEIAIEAMRFVLAGGTYVPAECLLSGIPSDSPAPQRPATTCVITARELAVVRAIQQSKPNKIIAYELNMCESTVKVHVRHIMKKLRAKNRTDVAIKATDLLSCSRCIGQSECWSTGRCLRKLA